MAGQFNIGGYIGLEFTQTKATDQLPLALWLLLVEFHYVLPNKDAGARGRRHIVWFKDEITWGPLNSCTRMSHQFVALI